MMAKSIHHEITFNAPTSEVYQELTNEREFQAFTGAPASINAASGEFSLFGGQIVGRNVELVEDRRIVQAWRVAGWPTGLYSIVRFELEPTVEGVAVSFDHTGYPEDAHDELDSGWQKMYWEPMAAHLAKGTAP